MTCTACSLLKEKVEINEHVNVKSIPSQSEVYSDSGELLGVTPLKIDAKLLSKIEKNGIVSVYIQKSGHSERQVSFPVLGVTNINITLNKLDDAAFERLMSGPLSGHINTIIKDVMSSQENIIRKNYKGARASLDRLIKKYPSISSHYILKAAIEINNKKYRAAKVLLQKSLNLDESNEVAKTYLMFVEKRIVR